jgi:glycosyltransferase involved in cell wall biosynthesis
MRVQIVTPVRMQWVSAYEDYFKGLGWEVDICDVAKDVGMPKQPDIYLLMWLNDDTVSFLNSGWVPDIPKIVFIRRYEFYTHAIERTNWKNVAEVVMLNSYFADGFEAVTGKKPNIIHNCVDLGKWTYNRKEHGSKIAVVGFINQKKNLPLALLILNECPKNYELHLAGDIQDGVTMDYLDNMAVALKLNKRVFLYGPVEDVNDWLKDKNYLLSTSISEGCPNNVIEAMAKGIKPVIHNWPGSDMMFKGFTFNTVGEATDMLMPDSSYNSASYRERVKNAFGENICNDIAQLISAVFKKD